VRSSLSVDLAQGALDTAARTLETNGIRADHELRKADAFDVLAALEPGRFDLIVVDPPNMAPSKAKLDRAIGAYRTLNSFAIERVAKGGLIATASCSSHVDEP